MYRARQVDAEQNRTHYADPISCPILAVGAYPDFFVDAANVNEATLAHPPAAKAHGRGQKRAR